VDEIRILPMSECKTEQMCAVCGNTLRKLLTAPNVIFKGDGWSTKNERIKRQMRDKNKKLTAKQNEMKRDAPNVDLAPNVDGQRVDSWSDAQKLAKSKGKDTKSYEPLIAKEKSNK
jgi:predicted nucleic acid-binding Zn ribbon protein